MLIRKTIKVKNTFWTMTLSSGKSKLKIALEEEIKNGLRNKEFYFDYQPQFEYDYNAKSFKVTGAELLVRWKKDNLISIAPDIFIPIAEKSGQIVGFGELAIIEACKTLQAFHKDEHLKNIILSVNISPLHVVVYGFLTFLRMTIAEYETDITKLKFEVTETTKIEDYSEIKLILDEIKAMGAPLSLDDFGSGYSSLLCLLHLPFDHIKIDKYFIDRMTECGNAMQVIISIRDIGLQMKRKIIAEGIESVTQLEKLLSIGIFEFQGFYFAKPMPLKEFATFCESSPIHSSLLEVALPLNECP